MNTETQIIILAFLIFASAYFSATETAYSSFNKIRMKSLANNNNKRAQKVLELVEDYDKILSTILIGNNIVNILSASLATVVFTLHFGEDIGVTISTIVMTILVLIFGEITPKSIAKERPEAFAMFSYPFLKFFVIILGPLNFVFGLWKKLFSILFKEKVDDGVTQEELITFIDEAQNEGGINEEEGDLIRAAIEFNDLDVEDILTPRVDLIAVDVTESLEDIEEKFRQNGFSRLPVYENSIDNIVGIIHEKDFYSLLYKNNKSLKSIVKEVSYCNPTMKISNLLKELQKTKRHMAVVVDEYGGTSGIVTLEDILEELVGEIWDEHDEIEEFFYKVNDHEFIISADADLEDMFEYLDINKGHEEFDFVSVGGWVIHQLGHIPQVGENFDFENVKVSVTKVAPRKVLEIKVEVILEKEEADNKKD